MHMLTMNSFISDNIDIFDLDLALSLDAPTSTDCVHQPKRPVSRDNQPNNGVTGYSSGNPAIELPFFSPTPLPASPLLYTASNASAIQNLNQSPVRSNTARERQQSSLLPRDRCTPQESTEARLAVCWNHVPGSVRRLYETITRSLSDWSFVYALAAQLCQDVLPMDCYVNLKLALLLSIASTQKNYSDNRAPVSIVALGADSVSINSIMNSVGSIAERFVVTSINSFGGTSRYDEKIFEAGPLQLASNGVFYVQDWARIKLSSANHIQNAVDLSKISDDKATGGCPLGCAIWTYFECNASSKLKDFKTLSMFVNVFGIPIVLEENTPNSLTDFILEESIFGSMQPIDDELNIPYDDMKVYVNTVGMLEVTMSPEASETLQAYFIATRKERLGVLSQRSYDALEKLSESHAKLCFRSLVLRRDAIVAISIAENFTNYMYGPGVKPSPVRTPLKHIEEIDEHMAAFERWVCEFIA